MVSLSSFIKKDVILHILNEVEALQEKTPTMKSIPIPCFPLPPPTEVYGSFAIAPKKFPIFSKEEIVQWVSLYESQMLVAADAVSTDCTVQLWLIPVNT